MGRGEFSQMTAKEIAKGVSGGKFSAVEVATDIIERAEEINPKINAIITNTFESAIAEAHAVDEKVKKGEDPGPLAGVPISIKDLVFTKGVRTTFGSKVFKNFVPDEDAVLVTRLREAGAVSLGKTNTPEFGCKAVTDNPIFGATKNPWNLSKTSGGSSGGSAAAVAAGLGPLATGSDGGGSIRIPSSFCGIFGIKPQYGRVPRYPMIDGWETLDHEGPIARTVEDAAIMLDVMAGHHPGDRYSLPNPGIKFSENLTGGVKGKKIALSLDYGYLVVDPVVKNIINEAALKFEKLGAHIEESNPGFENPEMPFITMVGCEIMAALEASGEIEEIKKLLDPFLSSFLPFIETLKGTDYAKSMFMRQRVFEKFYRFFEKYDLLITPTVAVPPFDLGIDAPPEISGQPISALGWMGFTFPINLATNPAASIPAGWTEDGLPVGMQIVGRLHDEVSVLSAARSFEQSHPWADKRPKIE